MIQYNEYMIFNFNENTQCADDLYYFFDLELNIPYFFDFIFI
jgi:hypothetical protein